jgi:hypothetical protein
MDIKDKLDDLRCLVYAASKQDDLHLVRGALYILREQAWDIMAEIDKRSLAEWERQQQAPRQSLTLEDIGL